MPSPIGHALGGQSLPDGSVGGPRGRRARRRASTPPIGVAPDLDLLVGTHSTYTHSVGAVAVWSLSRALAASQAPARGGRAIAAAWASHLLLDWLGSDTSPPIGIMALWPFSREHYQSSFYVFDAISRRYWLPEQFVWGNLKAALREVLILGPLAARQLLDDVRQPRDTETRRRTESSTEPHESLRVP